MKSVSKAFLTLVAFTLLLDACKKSDDPNPTTNLITFKTDASFLTKDSDNWIFATDESGNVLDIKEFEADQTVILTSDKITADKKFNFTIVQRVTIPVERFYLASYLGLTTDQKWPACYKAASGGSAPLPVAGNFTMNVSNYPPGFPYFLVSTNEALIYGSGTPGASNYGLRSTSPTKILVTSYRNNLPVYATLTATVGNTYNLDFLTDFKPMEHSLSFDVTGTASRSISLTAFDNPITLNQPKEIGPIGHTIANYDSFTNPTAPGNLVTGWPDGFATYKTSVRLAYSWGGKSYFKLGAGATSTPFLNITASVANEDFKNFEFTTTADYSVRFSGFANSNSSVVWTVISPPTGVHKFLGVPKELSEKYPVFGTMTLNRFDMTFFKYLDDFTYEGHVQFVGAAGPNSKEYQLTQFY
jgi:hypothetical protein